MASSNSHKVILNKATIEQDDLVAFNNYYVILFNDLIKILTEI